MKQTIYEQLIQAGVKQEDIGSHQSDLYVKKTEITEKIVNDYEFKGNVNTFISQIDGLLWYEIPFAYDLFWDKKTRNNR